MSAKESPLVRVLASVLYAASIALAATDVSAQPARPTVGVAFGGGSARGIAHIGVIQWFEENHIPIDVAAGTSMGGLVGGAFATGMSASELRALISGTDWDMLFGSSSFQFKNLRRKEDARSYPSRLEFGLKKGFAPPPALNDGQQVDLLLARMTAAYYGLERFDDLPTPFRVVAVDLLRGEKVVLDNGPFATALRATMSLPGIFPPVQRDGQVLVDGGALDNIPADVVKGFGVSAVIAIDVGLPPKSTVDYSIFGLLGQTVDAMMRTATRAALASADMTIAVDMEGFGSLDWRRADELIARGHQAAENHRDELLKCRLSDADWTVWAANRAGRRRTAVPQPSFVTTEGFASSDAAFVQHELAKHLDRPFDIRLLETDLTALSGLDRYQSVDWRMTTEGGRTGLLVQAREKIYAPPFLMLGLIVENTTSENFRAQLAARYLAFDAVGSGSELRIDGALGADPSIGASLYKPIGATRFFVRGTAGANRRTFNFISNDAIVAEYRESRVGAEGALGFNLSRVSELSGGFYGGRVNDTIRAGDPGLPELSGAETLARLRWVLDQQDSEVIPSRGLRLITSLSQTIASPEVTGAARTNKNVTQAELSLSSFYPVGPRYRLFAAFAGGTSFDDHPLPTRQFTVGYPFVLDAFTPGERRGDHYAALTLGAMRRIGRLPDFLGGPVFAGAWLENGSVFSTHQNADFNSQIGVGIVTETVVGPIFLGTSAGFDGGWRVRFGVGRIFR
jgi:NTE family protein